MGSQWLLLQLLFIGDGVFNLPGVRSDTMTFGEEYLFGNLRPSSTTSTPANTETTYTFGVSPSTSSVTAMISTSNFQNSISTATPSTSSQTSSTTGFTEHTAQGHETQKSEADSTSITPSKGTTSMMTSMLMDHGGTSRITALSTTGDDISSSGSMRTTVSEKSAATVTTALTALNMSKDMKESLSTITTVQPTAITFTTMFGNQEGETTAVASVLTTVFTEKDMNSVTSTMSTLSTTHYDTVTQTPSHSVESASSASTATTQSPETTVVHSTAIIPNVSGTTKSSTMAGASQVFPKYTQGSEPGAGVCALDEYPTRGEGCMCNDSYYAYSELSSMTVMLHCQPQEIEVVLSSCFLKTRHWILREGALSGCPNVSKMEQGRRGQAFLVDKKEGTCGLHLSTNSSHALYSLEVHFLKLSNNDFTTLNFSCTYPLMVNVSQTHPVISFPYSTIHVPGTGDTIVTLGIYMDPQLSSPLENRTAPLGSPLYVVLRATSSDPDRFVLVTNEVFASTDISRTSAAKATYHFVNKSCPVNNRLIQGLQANGASLKVTLAFKLHRFLSSDAFYLHGRVTLCDKRAGHRCKPTCGQKSPPRRNRPWDIQVREGLEFGYSWMVFGPIQISESNGSSSRNPAGTWVVIFLLMVIGWVLG